MKLARFLWDTVFIEIPNKRPPDFIIGPESSPYLLRWWVIPRNRFFNIYLHIILRSDDDRALHDHPWVNASFILNGCYQELTPCGLFERKCGSLTLRFPTSAHRIIITDKPAMSLFVTGPKVREWGFHCPSGWVHWEKFVNTTDHGQIGPGCPQ